MFMLFHVIFVVAAVVVDNLMGLSFSEGAAGVVYLFYVVATFLPGLALVVRRLHDIGKSGWMILTSLIPLIGSIWLIVLMVTEGEPSANQYGANPKLVALA